MSITRSSLSRRHLISCYRFDLRYSARLLSTSLYYVDAPPGGLSTDQAPLRSKPANATSRDGPTREGVGAHSSNPQLINFGRLQWRKSVNGIEAFVFHTLSLTKFSWLLRGLRRQCRSAGDPTSISADVYNSTVGADIHASVVKCPRIRCAPCTPRPSVVGPNIVLRTQQHFNKYAHKPKVSRSFEIHTLLFKTSIAVPFRIFTTIPRMWRLQWRESAPHVMSHFLTACFSRCPGHICPAGQSRDRSEDRQSKKVCSRSPLCRSAC